MSACFKGKGGEGRHSSFLPFPLYLRQSRFALVSPFLPLVIVLLAVMAAPAALAQRVDVISPTGRWVDDLVTDRADMLSPSEEQALTQSLRFYADSTSTQIVIVTLQDLEGADIAVYATELGQKWGVGQQGKDNGVVILVSRADREVFIATGFGLEGAIPDAVAGRIVREIVVPNFKQERFYAGLAGAVDALILAAAGEFTAESPPPAHAPPNQEEDIFGLLFVIFIIVMFIISALGRRGGGRGGGRRYRSRGGGPPVILWGGVWGSGGGGGGFGGGGFGGGGFGGGGFGGGGAGGSW